ncbi:sigma factor G inhibitor Gin [Alkalibacillus haloalkaliphilus]|uniref:sigma factor G inhibitor Gin n=1 Tax=Alkalibacillus haloalkaliphilus TaxID=94136 RepID=UPI0003179467|nr:sigma factor G inhibitor Gin [Alkalibacillus haloalkaliphilus]
MKGQSINCCQICGEWKQDGIHVLSSFICKGCEREIVNTNPDDERYQYFVDRLKFRRLLNQTTS